MTKRTAPSLYDALNLNALNLFNSIQPCDFFIGCVTKINPLEISIDSKHVLSEEYLKLTNAVKEHEVDISVSWATVIDNYLDFNTYTLPENRPMRHVHYDEKEGDFDISGDKIGDGVAVPKQWDAKHHHDIKGRKKIIVHNGLTVGEWVLLLRKQGGNDYIVLDRITPAEIKGEWI